MFGALGNGETVAHTAWVRDECNAHGQLRPVFADPVEIEGVGVDVPSVDEPRDGSSGRQVVDLVLFLPAGTTVDRRDTFTVRGVEYQVEGESPELPNFFTGAIFRTEVKVRRVTG